MSAAAEQACGRRSSSRSCPCRPRPAPRARPPAAARDDHARRSRPSAP